MVPTTKVEVRSGDCTWSATVRRFNALLFALWKHMNGYFFILRITKVFFLDLFDHNIFRIWMIKNYLDLILLVFTIL